ncbi:MAG: TetR family transcriptional regulator [Nocardioides sp.]|nr:TetR family transcriptional regulator [Nocardioides sp.]
MEASSQGEGRVALIDAAERLIAEQGPAVSLRQVVVAAGQRNSAAIRYHFGTREQLITAVVEARQAVFEPQRLERLVAIESAGGGTQRELLEALLGPAFEHQRASSPSFHARFMEKIRDFPGVVLVDRRDWTATTLLLSRIAPSGSRHDPEMVGPRTRGIISVVFALLADLERETFPDSASRTRAEEMTLDMVLGAVNSAPRVDQPG